ncbi:MAG: hypothetical protein QG559_1354 [Campylobacterota bacterium]|nr:hypothetical protein [Campylobacterota bacterium]
MQDKKTRLATHQLLFKDIAITHIVNKRLKNSYIQIDKEGSVILKTPALNDSYIYSLLAKKELWIKKRLIAIQNNQPKRVNLEDEVLLFGEIISIDRTEAKSLRACLERFQTLDQNSIEKCYEKFYRLYAKEYLTQRLDEYAEIMNLEYSEVRFKKMKRRWGSCSSKKIITLNTQLLKLKKEHIDYILIHELSHLVHMNHSKNFYSLIGRYMPHYKEIHKELKCFILY